MQNRRSFLNQGPMGQATKALSITLLATTLIGSITQRRMGFGVEDLAFDATAVLAGEIWRVFTFPFVELEFFGLLISLILLYFFGGLFEKKWGTVHYLRFYFLSCIGAALLAIPFGFLVNLLMPFRDAGIATGPNAAIDAMLVALVMTAPDANVLFGFVLPMKGRTMIQLFIGLQIIAGIMQGSAVLSVTLGGLAMGYILVSGIWRPNRLIAELRTRSTHKHRRGLYVVKPKDNKTTLH